MRSLLVGLVVALCFAVPASAETPVPVQRSWKVDGGERLALIYIPTAARTEKSPLIFAFHGHGGNMHYAARKFNYHTLWPEAIVVYMQGLPTPGALTDPQGLRNGWQSAAGTQGDRDLKFFDAVLASLQHEVKVDDKRIFATGHSNGGAFTYLLWAERGDTFAAVAPCAAIAARSQPKLKPKPVMHVAGENDPLVRYAWQQRTMDALKKLNGCDATGKEWAKSGSTTCTVYSSKSGPPVVTAIYPGAHNLPDEASALIVKFFKEQGAKKPIDSK